MALGHLTLLIAVTACLDNGCCRKSIKHYHFLICAPVGLFLHAEFQTHFLYISEPNLSKARKMDIGLAENVNRKGNTSRKGHKSAHH